MDIKMTSTTFEIPGYKIKNNLGVVRGIIVRSRSIFGNIGAGLQTLLGGNITILSELCEKTRNDAFNLMIQHAEKVGANGIIGVRYESTEIMAGVTEVLCYGTAVKVEQEEV
ncbi:MAG: YbjQ family protein [Bacteroidota bacterium]|nr:YbjQ family protein [Bacteroidota bacterium]